MTHQDLIVYGETEAASFPLILAIGREPSDEGGMAHVVGRYDFDEFPRCALWNASYGLVAWANGLETRELKALCRQRSASPLAYADSLPVPINNSVLDKMSLRKTILADGAERRVDRIFAHSIAARVGLVFLSGVGDQVFARSRTRAQQHSASLGVECIEVPFSYGTNTPRIRGAIPIDRRLLLRSLLDTSPASKPPVPAG